MTQNERGALQGNFALLLALKFCNPQLVGQPQNRPDRSPEKNMQPGDFIADENSPAARPILALPPKRQKLEPAAEESENEDAEEELDDESFQTAATSSYSANDDMGSSEVTEYLREQACRSTPHPAGGIARTSGGRAAHHTSCVHHRTDSCPSQSSQRSWHASWRT